jgi:hypothetical protein
VFGVVGKWLYFVYSILLDLQRVFLIENINLGSKFFMDKEIMLDENDEFAV